MQNKLIHLISSPFIKLYSRKEREGKACVIDADKIYKQLLPAITNGADKHVKLRIEAVKRRADKSTLTDQTKVNQIVEALDDSHFRKQKSKGPTKIEIANKLKHADFNNNVLNLFGLMFTRKNICPLRRGGGDEASTDLAEVISLTNLNSFSALVNHFYPHVVKYSILSEGKLLSKAFDYSSEKAVAYQDNILNWIEILNLK